MRKPPGYWKNGDNFQTELETVIDELNHFPTQKELREMGRSDITAAFKHYGGFSKVKQKLGYEQSQKPDGYWENWDNFQTELETVIEELGHFPTGTELKALKRSDIKSAFKHYGGFPKVKQKLGYEQSTKPRGYWENWDNFRTELEAVIDELNHFPTSTELGKRGNSSLALAFQNYGGFSKVKQKLGYEQSQKPEGYWENWDNFQTELEAVIEELGHFPSYKDLKEMGNSSLAAAFQNYGGFSKVKQKLGYEQSQKPEGYWENWDNFQTELEAVIDELNHFPTSTKLREMGNSSLAAAFQNYGGFSKVKQKLGYEQSQKPEGYWENWDNFQTELEAVIEELGHFPTGTKLREMGRSDLAVAFQQYGGFPKVRKRLGYELLQSPHGYWKNWDNFQTELEAVIDELNHFPTQRELTVIKRSDLRHAFQHHGGISKVKKKLGYATISTPQQFQTFLEQDETARDLAAVATAFNGEDYEIEQVILDLYSHKFKDQQKLHELLKQQEDKIKEMIDQGLTNLGTYLGEFTIGDRRIIPLLIDQTLITIPREAVTPDLEERMLGMLDNAYSPRFNENPEETMQEIATKAKSPETEHPKLYTRLLERYQRVMDIMEELNN